MKVIGWFLSGPSSCSMLRSRLNLSFLSFSLTHGTEELEEHLDYSFAVTGPEVRCSISALSVPESHAGAFFLPAVATLCYGSLGLLIQGIRRNST